MTAHSRLLGTHNRLFFLTADYAYCPEALLRTANKVSGRWGSPSTNFTDNLLSYYSLLEESEYNSLTASQRQAHLIVNLAFSLLQSNFPWLGDLRDSHAVSSQICQLLCCPSSRLEDSHFWLLQQSLSTLLSSPLHASHLQVARELAERLGSLDLLSGYLDEVHTTNLEEEFLKLELKEARALIAEKWGGCGLAYLGISEGTLEALEGQRLKAVLGAMAAFRPQRLQPAVPPKAADPLATLDKYLQILPEEVKLEVEPFTCEGIEVVVRRDIALFNDVVRKLKRLLHQLKNHLANSIILSSQDRQVLESVAEDRVPGCLGQSPSSFTAYIGRLHERGKFMAGLEASRFRLRGYPLSNFMDPRSIILRLVQIERKRLRLQSATPYLKLLSNGVPEGFNINETSIYLLDLGLECCRYDPLKNCLEELPDSLSVGRAPAAQLMVAENLPASNNYVNVPVVDRERRALLRIDVPVKKGADAEFTEMRLMVGYDAQ